MSWGRMDDGFHDHPKVEALSLDAVGMWTLCWSYANRHVKTAPMKGFITEARARGEAAKRNVSAKRFTQLIRELTAPLPGGEHGMWEPVDGGWVLHDFEQYLRKRRDPEEAAESGRKGAQVRKQNEGKPIANSYPDSQDNSHPISQEEASNSDANSQEIDSSRVPTRASPSRPVPIDSSLERGDRYVPAREPDATNPPPKCTRHPNGNASGEPCAGCARLREWDEQQTQRDRQAVTNQRHNCPDCDDNGMQLDPDTSMPVRRCNHNQRRRAS